MSLLKALGGASGSVVPKLDASDVFSTYLRIGTGADVVTTTGIDMTKGYLLWSKSRSVASDHALYDSSRGLTKDLVCNSTSAETTQATGLKAVSTTGHTVGSLAKMNTLSATYVDYVLREAPKFFHQELKVHTNGTASTVDLSTLGTVGMVTVKSTVNTGNWFTWHRSLTAGNNLKLNLTDAQSTTNAYLSVSGTTLTIASTAPSDTYIVYAWAHDTSADGIIQCGSYVGNGSTTGPIVTLGYEPQYVMVKTSSTTGNWTIIDNMRGLNETTYNYLRANTSSTEVGGTGAWFRPLATGFQSLSSTDGDINTSGQTYIYMAIRRPNKVPTSGTEVYNAIARTGTGAVATVSGVGFAPDLVHVFERTSSGSHQAWCDRLRGKPPLYSDTTNSENTASTDGFLAFTMDGMSIGADSYGYINNNTYPLINHFFKRAKGFFDNFCYTGTGVNRTTPHNLGAIPDLLIIKSRSATADWQLWFNGLSATEKLVLNTTAAKVTDATLLNSTLPTSTAISLGTQAAANTSAATYVGYAFSNIPAIQSIGTYTGNGSSQTLNFGFTSGARFFLCKAVSTTGSYWVFDSVRGIVASTDFGLQLNSTAAEVTSADCVDPSSSGIIVNQEATCSINANGVIYMYWAIS